jgi:cell division transport system permease protein
MRLGFFLRESLRSMRRNAAPSFAALATVLVTMLVLGVFIPVFQAATGAANSVRGRVLVDVYMKTTATAADDARVHKEILALPHVKTVQFESKAQALAQQSKQDPAAYALLSGNPLPDTFHVVPDNPGNVLIVRGELAPKGPDGRAGMIDPAIQPVSNHTEDTQKILTITSDLKWILLTLTLLLVTASTLLIANTIRLSLYSRRREVEVMKLVGATDWFIRWPFVIEGVIVGALGAMFAIVLLAVTKIALLDPLASNWSLISAPRTIGFAWLMVVLLGAGVAISALGSGVSLRRFLRV